MTSHSATAVTMTNRYQNEIRHGRRIAENAEHIWGWGRPTGPVRLKRRTDFFVQAGGLAPGKAALELGCGTGLITQILSESGAQITAVDLSPDLLEKARQRNLSALVSFRRENAEALDLPDAAFDAAVGSSVLHHLDLGRALPELTRVLRPGGRIAFSEPNMVNPHIFLQKNIPWLKRLAGDTPNETAYVRWRLARRLANAGFRNIEITPYDFLHPMVPTSLIPLVSSIGRTLERVPILREIAGSLLITAVKD